MRVAAISIFPEMFRAITDYGVSGRAVSEGHLVLDCINPRTFTHDRHRTVDDRPYGGGPGMVMKAEPVEAAIDEAVERVGGEAKVICLSPQGRVLDQAMVESLAAEPGLVLLSGRYEGIDERVLESRVDEEISIGDYVLSGGELAAMVLVDAVVRQIPGVLGHSQSAVEDSFADGLLDCPHYTRPEEHRGSRVPEVLLGGDHERIRRWRLKQSLQRTLIRRPELLRERELTAEEQRLLAEIENERPDGGSDW
ncbi:MULTISPECIES: tRNA (guanosine(37)-N1)-methyltransferase TrmD [Gammaproteobacteria]|uniref:tRNA (guanine-N(1)-)-methyltransferase n=1 Tax=Vreelandella halophila TaxID=86177 RepID=A0A9X4YAQ4_9GAMM|nr:MULTISPECIES: tRNA (guanosine(37)-N1)-methyltransferase TrmD [Gammaproteobacteria]KAA8978562.1 tRNA (guanosine(37)-N1)-methyltransferase TrmD [Halospina sp. K52047b]MYL26437.1 tRNA (guanosine(37)-N1)-methyltransferase TrmD [Halomonas utahensis]MYL73774.1 tRNA (guanosine(37)-N1)-methyltransferase TrmD [Halomonas sp. 22501_18_FS]